MRTWVIYALMDPRTNVIRYVGVTFRRRQRFNEHLSKARKGGRTHRDCWLRQLLDLGLRPLVKILEEGTGPAWREAERRWIATYHTTLVNHTDGGEGTPGYVPTPELRAKWSKDRRGRKYPPGRIPGMLGKTHSSETRAKLAAASRLRGQSDSAKAKVSVARRGKPLSLSHREKLSAAHSGKTLTTAHRAKIAASTRNRKRVLCVESGVVFPSVTAAAREIGVSEASVTQAIRKNARCRGNHYRFA